MRLRPLDASGDVLPVGSAGVLLSGPEAVAQLVQYRLSLLRGEWWENPGWGFFLLDSLQSSRLTEAETAAVSSDVLSAGAAVSTASGTDVSALPPVAACPHPTVMARAAQSANVNHIFFCFIVCTPFVSVYRNEVICYL